VTSLVRLLRRERHLAQFTETLNLNFIFTANLKYSVNDSYQWRSPLTYFIWQLNNIRINFIDICIIKRFGLLHEVSVDTIIRCLEKAVSLCVFKSIPPAIFEVYSADQKC